MSGKGDGRRPQEVDEQVMEENWRRIFGEPKQDERPEQESHG